MTEPSKRLLRGLLALLAALPVVQPATALGEPALRRAFVTSASGTGDLSTWGGVSNGLDGIAGANAACQNLAENAGLAPSGEQFRAWISDSTTDAWCNVQGLTGKRFTNPACGGGVPTPLGPWARTDGVLLAEGLTQIATASEMLYVPLGIDEQGAEVTSALSFLTGTFTNGAASSSHCTGWTTTSGQDQPGHALAIVSWGQSASLLACSTPQRIACFELGEGLPVRKPSAPGHLVFVSVGTGTGDLSTWADAGGEIGIAAADEVCRAEASSAGLPAPDSFHAWLSDPSTDAACHARGLPGVVASSCDGATPPPDAPYRRIDGFEIGADFDDLLDGRLGTGIVLGPGGIVAGPGSPATGTLANGTLSGQGSCAGWTVGTSGEVFQYGFAFDANQRWTQAGGVLCSSSMRLYCVSAAVSIFWDGFENDDFSRWSLTSP